MSQSFCQIKIDREIYMQKTGDRKKVRKDAQPLPCARHHGWYTHALCFDQERRRHWASRAGRSSGWSPRGQESARRTWRPTQTLSLQPPPPPLRVSLSSPNMFNASAELIKRFLSANSNCAWLFILYSTDYFYYIVLVGHEVPSLAVYFCVSLCGKGCAGLITGSLSTQLFPLKVAAASSFCFVLFCVSESL